MRPYIRWSGPCIAHGGCVQVPMAIANLALWVALNSHNLPVRVACRNKRLRFPLLEFSAPNGVIQTRSWEPKPHGHCGTSWSICWNCQQSEGTVIQGRCPLLCRSALMISHRTACLNLRVVLIWLF